MSDALDLAAHLRYYESLGVDGLSRDEAWRVRRADASRAVGEAATPTAELPRDSVPPAASAPAVVPVAASGALLDAAGRLRMIRDDIGECTRCKLHSGRTNLVFGVGHPEARLMFVGEGPGADEDEQGEPFVGRAGQLLTQIIKAMGLAREEVYIANVVKCRPPGNRNPEPDEIAQCTPFLQAQIDAIKPVVIVALGKFAAQTLLQTETPISRLRGRFHPVGGVDVMPTFHPSYLLRNPAAKREVWEDMKMVMKRLQEST
jgi:uracil-DNA glycosylase family 4